MARYIAKGHPYRDDEPEPNPEEEAAIMRGDYDLELDEHEHRFGEPVERYEPIPPFEHSARCKAGEMLRLLERETWRRSYPNYCKTCNGWGQFYSSFKPDAGPGYLEDIEPCNNCTADGLCARCGGPLSPVDASGPCQDCGWNYDDGMPPEWECLCEEQILEHGYPEDMLPF